MGADAAAAAPGAGGATTPRRVALLLGVGVLGGLASGLLGIGGGLVVVPILGAWLRVPIKVAVGTSLLTVLTTSVVGVATEYLVAPQNLHGREAVALAAGAVLGSLLGARLIARTAPGLLAKLMAFVLVVAALRMAGAFRLLGLDGEGAAPPIVGDAAIVFAHLGTGVGAGVVAMMFGVGILFGLYNLGRLVLGLYLVRGWTSLMLMNLLTSGAVMICGTDNEVETR